MADSTSRPTVSRRREIGQASARSLLMTMLGEFVLPRGGPVWTQTLVSALALLGVEPKSARQALARTAAEGWLESERAGRRVRWSLTPPGRRLLAEGAQRIYAFGREEVEWDGRWLLLLVSVPESQRDLRHRIRTQLNWAGFGSPAPGVWVSPHPSQQAEAERILADTGLSGSAMSFLASYGQVGSQDMLMARSWDLDALQQCYADFIDEFTGLDPATGEAALRAQTRLVHEWRRFPFLDPRLPEQLLPEGWGGTKAADLFHTRHSDWHPAAQRHWDRLGGA
jgi:phenylacetic acid degradation operon negative regulatory protein